MELNLFANFCLNIKCWNFDLIHFRRKLLYMHTHNIQKQSSAKINKNNNTNNKTPNVIPHNNDVFTYLSFHFLSHTHTEPFANIALAFPWNDTATHTHARTYTTVLTLASFKGTKNIRVKRRQLCYNAIKYALIK